MNIFANANEFLGEIRPESLKKALAEFYAAVSVIKGRLGNDSGLLDEYIENVFDAICRTINIETASTIGFSRCMTELLDLCKGIMQGDEKNKTHSLYEKAKQYIELYPFPDNDTLSRTNAYSGALMGDYFKKAAEECYNDFRSTLASCGYIAEIETLYNRICGILGSEEEMEQLNAIIKRGFILVPAMTAFTQGAIHAMLGRISERDDTLKYVFEMVMDIQ